MSSSSRKGVGHPGEGDRDLDVKLSILITLWEAESVIAVSTGDSDAESGGE